MSSSQTLLAEQLEQLLLLEKLLLKEKDILQQHNPDALVALTTEKNNLLVAIENLDNAIGMNPQFKADKAAGLFKTELAAIENCLLRCKERNNINGQVLNQSQLAVERLKTNLLENRSKTTLTYDNKGKKSGGLSSLGFKA